MLCSKANLKELALFFNYIKNHMTLIVNKIRFIVFFDILEIFKLVYI